MTKKNIGCAGCGAGLGNMLRSNRVVQNILSSGSAPASPSVAGIVSRREVLKGGIATLGALSLASCAETVEEAPARVFTGGTILTVDANFSEADAIATRGNRIIAVGPEDEVRAAAGANAESVNLSGKTMLPGFIDAHTHVIAGAVVDAVMENVGMAKYGTVAEVLGHIANRAATTPAGEWLVFRNFDPAVQEGLDALTFDELDAISTQHPIFVLNASGHLAYANTKAFDVAGVPDDVENPPGAEFVRDAQGKLTGIMKNNVAYSRIMNAYPALANADPIEALIGLLSKWSRHGLTTVSELSFGGLSQSPADMQIMMAAANSGRLAARIRA
ncbi:MAG: amidohydrolase family protein, partial [Woeseiaceae bacterium]|nr:amidohydrolase family protein [Woeseiaceae bacterium]